LIGAAGVPGKQCAWRCAAIYTQSHLACVIPNLETTGRYIPLLVLSAADALGQRPRPFRSPHHTISRIAALVGGVRPHRTAASVLLGFEPGSNLSAVPSLR